MSLYIDSSAAAKLMFAEAESEALKAYLTERSEHGEGVFTSWIAETELLRAAQRADQPVDLAFGVLRLMNVVGLARDVYIDAGLLGGKNLRSLDAVHVVVAQRIQAGAFVTYDERQAAAATAAGLSVTAPS